MQDPQKIEILFCNGPRAGEREHISRPVATYFHTYVEDWSQGSGNLTTAGVKILVYEINKEARTAWLHEKKTAKANGALRDAQTAAPADGHYLPHQPERSPHAYTQRTQNKKFGWRDLVRNAARDILGAAALGAAAYIVIRVGSMIASLLL